MPGLVPGIQVFAAKAGVDGRDKPGHDDVGKTRTMTASAYIPCPGRTRRISIAVALVRAT
jgi:hypothetical protein